ncbi:hypothetical protein TNCV_1678271 [Trichonephila clavipes]|nr:hypothetical protein TNCV_1678271 [Trichonephila clavipes]
MLRAQQSNMQSDLRMHICEHIISVLQHQKDVNQKEHICVKHDLVVSNHTTTVTLHSGTIQWKILAAQRYQANGSHCEVKAVLTCPKPIPKVNLVPRPKRTTAFGGFTRVNKQGERNKYIQGNTQICQSRRIEQNIHRRNN